MPADFDRKEHCLRIGLNTRFVKNRVLGKCILCNQQIEYIKSKPRKFCGYKCSNKWISSKRKYSSGKQNHLWKGGITPISKMRVNNARWRKIADYIRNRDNNKCLGCHSGGKLYVHHLIPWRITKDDNEENLITLCGSCHQKQEANLRKINDWPNYLLQLKRQGFYATRIR